MTAERVVIVDGQRVTERNAKRIVRARRPDLRAERHQTLGGEVYYWIRGTGPRGLTAFMPFSEGRTERKAWLNAAAKLEGAETRIEHDAVEALTEPGQRLSEPGITITYIGGTPRVPRRWAVDVEGRPRTVARSPGRVMFNIRVARRARSK